MHYLLMFIMFLTGIFGTAFVLAGLFNPAVGRQLTWIFYVAGAGCLTVTVGLAQYLF